MRHVCAWCGWQLGVSVKAVALVVHGARYGWAGDIWNAAPGSGTNHGGGAKDVTDVVRHMITNDELHINPNSEGQYMNRTFWPETSRGPAIPRKLAVRYSYGDSPILIAETHETVSLHVTSVAAKAAMSAMPVLTVDGLPVLPVKEHTAAGTIGIAVGGIDPHGRVFRFSSCNSSAFDTEGVLYALGTDFWRSGYTNPADSGKVTMSWSADAANYYSKRGGHKPGDARQAASIICANKHPGADATMWSLGAAGAWFAIDLVSIQLHVTCFAFRNDYGGGGNHPRTFELQGSTDGGSSWATLSAHQGEAWSGNTAKSWPVKSAAEQYYGQLRIVNKGHEPSVLLWHRILRTRSQHKTASGNCVLCVMILSGIILRR